MCAVKQTRRSYTRFCVRLHLFLPIRPYQPATSQATADLLNPQVQAEIGEHNKPIASCFMLAFAWQFSILSPPLPFVWVACIVCIVSLTCVVRSSYSADAL